jgi:hypothetical protein
MRAGFTLPNILNFLTSHNLTKMAVVQLRRRKWPERGRKRPKVAAHTGRRGSDNSPGMAAFRGFTGQSTR